MWSKLQHVHGPQPSLQGQSQEITRVSWNHSQVCLLVWHLQHVSIKERRGRGKGRGEGEERRGREL